MKSVLTLFITFLCVLSIYAQTTRYVRADGTGDGLSWATASGVLQQMINASSPGDEVWVAEGVYTPTNLIVLPFDNSHPVERRSTFTIHSGVHLYGGFAADGNPGMGDRNFELFPTTLSGDIGVANDSTDNVYHVLFFPGTSGATVDGFTIEGGTANGNSANGNAETYVPSLFLSIPNYRGGAIYMYNAENISIANCIMRSNKATYEGGAVFMSAGSQQFTNTTFEGNIGGGAGGAVCGLQSTCTIDDSGFLNNTVGPQEGGPFPMPTPAYTNGGGAVAIYNGNLTVLNSFFVGNNAYVTFNTNNARGGAIDLQGGNHVISQNLFVGNSSTFLPAGVQVCVGGAINLSGGNADFVQNNFIDNFTHGSGGALGIISGTHTMYGNRFTENQSVGNGGALSCTSTSVDVVNNIFEFNSSENNGGAIHGLFNSGTNKYVNNTFYANSSVNNGSGIYLDNRTDHLLNNIFWGNLSNGTSFNSTITFSSSGASTLFHNLLEVALEGNGNIGAVDPLFADASNGDYTLNAASPCINAGSNDHYLSTYGPEDFLGNNRFYNEIIDMGAIEAQVDGTAVSVETNYGDANLLHIFPNPSVSGTEVQVRAVHGGVMRIYDTNGRLHLSVNLKPGINSLDVELSPGLYFARQHSSPTLKLVVY